MEDPRELRLRVPEDLRVYADEGKTRQVILNLLSNAVKYSPPGSPIEIDAGDRGYRTTRRSEQADDRGACARPWAWHPDGAGRLDLRAFCAAGPRRRLERSGTGLGLAICQAYVKAMGGEIWATSAGVEGEGTTMHFTLPLAPDTSRE